MNKKEAIKEMLDGNKIRSVDWPNGHFLKWSKDNNRIDNDTGYEWAPSLMGEAGWELYEEPVKETPPKHIDIEVKPPIGLSLSVSISGEIWVLGSVIGACLERNEIRYFATWYVIEDGLFSRPQHEDTESGKCTFASHVRFVREDLLGGIPGI